MKQGYNRNTYTDVPLDASFNASSSWLTDRNSPSLKPKINAIGKKAQDELRYRTTKQDSTRMYSPKVETRVRQSTQRAYTYSDDLERLNERLNEENLKTFRNKIKRNRFIIAMLVISIIAAVSTISAYIVIIKLNINCTFHINGASAAYILDGEEVSSFRTPTNIQGNSIFAINIKLKIRDSGYFNIVFKPECTYNGILMKNTLIYGANFEMFYEEGVGEFRSRLPIRGKQTILLCEGVVLDYDYKDKVNADNFRLKFYTYLEKV